MSNVNANKDESIKLLRNYIYDLSFENAQSINENDYVSNSNIEDNINVIFKPYKEKFFSLIIKYNLVCSSKQNNKKLFIFELDYYGFFEIVGASNYDQKLLTEKGTKLLFPLVKEIVEYITKNGGSVPILLKEPDFSLRKI